MNYWEAVKINGTDNENIGVKELLEFLDEVIEGKAICPKCNQNHLEIKDKTVHELESPFSSTFIRGISDHFWIYAEISCQCGFHQRFNTDWCRLGFDGKSKQHYRVGLAVGGIMEKPDFTYEDIDDIEAYSELDAIEKYKEKHHPEYWSVVIC